MLGSSLFIDEINTCADILKKSQPVYARYMFIRSVRKLLKRFDPVLWEGSEPKFKQSIGSAEKAEELLRGIKIYGELGAPEKLSKNIDKIVNECSKIVEGYNSDNIPIDQIRRINSWAHTASDSVKVVIIENADTMGESSRNSLLKLLEEPPRDCYFILTTSRKGAIIPTILSRTRIFNFSERGPEETSEVISKIFREQNGGYRNIREFFLSRKADTAQLKELASSFVKAVISKNPPGNMNAAGNFKTILSSRQVFVLFIQECIELLREEFSLGRLDTGRAEKLNALFNEAFNMRDKYNQSAQLVLESLYYKGTAF